MSNWMAHGTVSSEGIVTTTGANQVFDFSKNRLNSIYIKAEGNDINVKFNDEATFHFVKNGDSLHFPNLQVRDFTIVENNVSLSYHGTFY